MKKCKLREYAGVLIFLGLILLMVGFIWTNSSLSRATSGAQSGFIVRYLRPLMDPNGVLPEATFHLLIRKAAHFLEFAMLGLLFGGLFRFVSAKSGKQFWSLPILLTLLVAVLDEYIQVFSGRGSAVADVLLDFSGGITGICVVAAIVALRKKK
jgi:VanZ family protein